MTDIRKCDGPDCDVVAVLNPRIVIMGTFTAESFITLESGNRDAHPDLHFHNSDCLTKWVKKNTTVGSRSAV